MRYGGYALGEINMRYSGHKRVKKTLTLIHFFTQIQLFNIHTYFNFNLTGYFKIFHPEKEPPPPRPDLPRDVIRF